MTDVHVQWKNSEKILTNIKQSSAVAQKLQNDPHVILNAFLSNKRHPK